MINFITAADTVYFTRVCGLIGSIIRKGQYNSIRVYNLGLKPEQIEFLNSFPRVKVHEVQKVNPEITKQLRSHEIGPDKMVPGLYSWKPVIINDALSEFKEVFYLDAGVTITQDVMPIMEHIKEHNYFFLETSKIGWMTNDYVKEKLKVGSQELYEPGLNAGMQALNRNTLYDYILPMVEYAKDINLFKDQGTAMGGFSSGRHDQTLFSIQALRANMIPLKSQFVINGKNYNVTEHPIEINEETLIYHCRGNSDWDGDFTYMKKFEPSLFK